MINIPIEKRIENPVAAPYFEIKYPPARGAKTVPAPTVKEYTPIVEPLPEEGAMSASSASPAGVNASSPVPNNTINGIATYLFKSN